MDKAEYTIFEFLLKKSEIGAILNEDAIPFSGIIELPASYRKRIIPDHIYERQKHSDVRIARRAATIANLARLISERDVRAGIRRTLLTQARRLELLASKRLEDLGVDYAFNSDTGDQKSDSA